LRIEPAAVTSEAAQLTSFVQKALQRAGESGSVPA
jgi:hypothetical protein